MYTNRSLDKSFKSALNKSQIILLTGLRQVGKSTCLLNGFRDFTYVNLDDDNEMMLASKDPVLFFKDRDYPLVIDNINNGLCLIPEIKKIIDKNSDYKIILIGRNSSLLFDMCTKYINNNFYHIDVPPFSLREKNNIDFNSYFLPNEKYFKKRKEDIKEYKDIWDNIYRGSFPFLLNKNNDWQDYYRDYLKIYIERDLKSLVNVKDELKFRQFLISIAARTAQTIVYKEIADDVGVDIKTIQKWLKVVEDTGLVKVIDTYRNKYTKRAIKSPKLYFMDTGIVCYLGGWNSALQAKNGAMSKYLFETLVVSEILKSYLNEGKKIDDCIFYYREKGGKEIDLILIDNKDIYPVEIKHSSIVDDSVTKIFNILKCPKDYNVKNKTVICRNDDIDVMKNNINLVSINYI